MITLEERNSTDFRPKTQEMSEFENIGYFKEYYVDSKFIGTLNCELGNREVGYTGRLGEVVFEKIKLSNKKIIKAGTFVTTIVYPLCGRLKKK